MKKILTVDHGSLRILDEYKQLIFHIHDNTIFMDDCICLDEKSDAEIFQDLVEEGANLELPHEKKKRLKEETRQFLNTKSGKFHNRRF